MKTGLDEKLWTKTGWTKAGWTKTGRTQYLYSVHIHYTMLIRTWKSLLEESDPCESQPHNGHLNSKLNSKTIPILPFLYPSLKFFFSSFTFSGAPYRIFLLFLTWFPYHLILQLKVVIIEIQTIRVKYSFSKIKFLNIVRTIHSPIINYTWNNLMENWIYVFILEPFWLISLLYDVYYLYLVYYQ